MRQILNEFLGILILVVPLVAIRWNLAGENRRRSSLMAPENLGTRWRLEIYSTSDDAPEALVDPADVPFPVKRVRSVKVQQAAGVALDDRWTLPRVELDVDVADPLSGEALAGLFGQDHRVRFVSGDEAVIDTPIARIRVRAQRHA